MNRPLVKVLALALFLGSGFGVLIAQQTAPTLTPAATASTTPRIAVIKESNVNARGQATIHSEVITQFQEGERLTVLEDITLKNPKKGDPERWVRVSLPPTSHVWVHGSFIDLDTHTIKADVLNLRGGPGENYSVIGRASKGTVVKEVERKADWIKIEAPHEAYAFVAAYLVNLESGTLPAATATVAVNETPTTTAIPSESGTDATKTPALDLVAVEEPGTPAQAAPPEVPAPAESSEPPVVSEETPVQPVEPPPPPPKRIVRREGIVRRSLSIQAPTSFVLDDIEGRRTINYLHPPSTNIVLIDFFGMRVVVTGEEMLDERWPKTPVINIDSIEPVP